jgi:hypothetical protein
LAQFTSVVLDLKRSFRMGIFFKLQPLAAQQHRASGAGVDAELSGIIMEINDLRKFGRSAFAKAAARQTLRLN